jgi:hypothetical protein
MVRWRMGKSLESGGSIGRWRGRSFNHMGAV